MTLAVDSEPDVENANSIKIDSDIFEFLNNDKTHDLTRSKPIAEISISSKSISILLCPGRFTDVYILSQKIYELPRKRAFKLLNKGSEELYENESEILKLLSTPERSPKILYIVRKCTLNEIPCFEMEACRRLSDYLKEAPVSIETCATEIARGLLFIHGKGIIHRNLGLSNILVDRKDEIKISDFKYAIQASMAQGIQGSIKYASPQMVAGEFYSNKTDVWSLGCIVYELASGFKPFSSNKEKQTQKLIKSVNYVPLADQSLQKIIGKCLIADERKRFNAEGVIESIPIKDIQLSKAPSRPSTPRHDPLRSLTSIPNLDKKFLSIRIHNTTSRKNNQYHSRNEKGVNKLKNKVNENATLNNEQREEAKANIDEAATKVKNIQNINEIKKLLNELRASINKPGKLNESRFILKKIEQMLNLDQNVLQLQQDLDRLVERLRKVNGIESYLFNFIDSESLENKEAAKELLESLEKDNNQDKDLTNHIRRLINTQEFQYESQQIEKVKQTDIDFLKLVKVVVLSMFMVFLFVMDLFLDGYNAYEFWQKGQVVYFQLSCLFFLAPGIITASYFYFSEPHTSINSGKFAFVSYSFYGASISNYFKQINFKMKQLKVDYYCKKFNREKKEKQNLSSVLTKVAFSTYYRYKYRVVVLSIIELVAERIFQLIMLSYIGFTESDEQNLISRNQSYKIDNEYFQFDFKATKQFDQLANMIFSVIAISLASQHCVYKLAAKPFKTKGIQTPGGFIKQIRVLSNMALLTIRVACLTCLMSVNKPCLFFATIYFLLRIMILAWVYKQFYVNDIIENLKKNGKEYIYAHCYLVPALFSFVSNFAFIENFDHKNKLYIFNQIVMLVENVSFILIANQFRSRSCHFQLFLSFVPYCFISFEVLHTWIFNKKVKNLQAIDKKGSNNDDDNKVEFTMRRLIETLLDKNLLTNSFCKAVDLEFKKVKSK